MIEKNIDTYMFVCVYISVFTSLTYQTPKRALITEDFRQVFQQCLEFVVTVIKLFRHHQLADEIRHSVEKDSLNTFKWFNLFSCDCVTFLCLYGLLQVCGLFRDALLSDVYAKAKTRQGRKGRAALSLPYSTNTVICQPAFPVEIMLSTALQGLSTKLSACVTMVSFTILYPHTNTILSPPRRILNTSPKR